MTTTTMPTESVSHSLINSFSFTNSIRICQKFSNVSILQLVHTFERNSRPTDNRFLKEARGSLTITNVMLEDDGKWQCEAENANGYIENGRPIQLVVLGNVYDDAHVHANAHSLTYILCINRHTHWLLFLLPFSVIRYVT